MVKPYGIIDPNSQHQLWSRWTFRVVSGRVVPLAEVEPNAMKWLRLGFGSVGRARVYEQVVHQRVVTMIEAEVEGVPAHDPDYVESVRRSFTQFVDKGWGPLSFSVVKVEILAGDLQDGKPRTQLVVMPHIKLR